MSSLTGPATRDPGLQPERTRLAWRRTVLAVTVVALLAARLAVVRGAPLAVAGTALLWLAGLAVGHRRIVTVSRGKAGPAGPAPLLLGSAVVGLAVLGVLLVIVG